MSAITSLLGMVPGWVYAAACAALMATNCATTLRLPSEKADHAALKAAVAEQKAQAAKTLAAETERVRGAEQALQTALNTQNTKDYTNAQKIETLRRRLADAAAVGLRDPSSGSCGGGSASAATAAPGVSTADTTQASGVLSASLVGLLQSITIDADRINAAYASCRADAYEVRGMPQP